MQPLTIVILAVVCSVTAARFSCGNDVMQSQFAQLLVQNDCKGRIDKMDKCCRNHTKCYTKGKPQAACDANFCKCATLWAAKGSAPCTTHANVFCTTAKSFGALNYNRLKEEGKKGRK